jgi:gas vesicle protein
MAWELLPVDYTDAVWSGLKRYNVVTNDDGTVSFQDVTQYSNREKSFFGAKDANSMNEALNTLMNMVENGTDLYEAFQNYFNEQKSDFEAEANSKQSDFTAYVDNLKKDGDDAISTIKTDYREEITAYEAQQEQIFNAWFQAMQNQLSQDAAGNLQNQCTELDERLSNLEVMNIKNTFYAPLATDDTDVVTLICDDNDVAILADWKYKEV